MSILSLIKKHRVFIGFGMITAVLFIGASVYAAPVLESGIPGVGAGGAQGAAVPNLPTYINYLYIFVLGFVGIAGFISLVIWGTVWVGSAVVDKKAMAMEGIKNALTGIGIAFTAFIMLYTINPDLTIIKVPTAKKLDVKESTQSLSLTGSSNLKADGFSCENSSQCYPDSKCANMTTIKDLSGNTITSGKCERLTGILNAGEWACSVNDSSSTTCIGNGLGECKYCVMPDKKKRCIKNTNSYNTSCVYYEKK